MQRLHDYLWESKHPEFTLKDSFIIPPKLLAAYRFIALGISIYTFILCNGTSISSFKFLTNWGVAFVTCYFIFACLCYVIYRNEEDVGRSNPIAFWKVTHFLCELCFSLEVLIPVYYWTLLYPATTHHHIGDQFLKNIMAHLTIPILIHIEVIFNKIKFYKRHPLVILIVTVMYAILNFTYTRITGKTIYANLTWNDYRTVFLVIGSLVLVVGGFYSMVCFSAKKFGKNSKGTTALGNSRSDLSLQIML